MNKNIHRTAERTFNLFVVIGFAFSYFQTAWADVDDEILKDVEETLTSQIQQDKNDHETDFSSWAKFANEVDEFIKHQCTLPNLSANCLKLKNKFIKQTKGVYEASEAWRLPPGADFKNAKKFQQKTLKILSYGNTFEEKLEETKRSHLESLSYLGCNGSNAPMATKEVENCLPKDLSKRILDITPLDPDVAGMIVDYIPSDVAIEFKSFEECAAHKKNDFKAFNIRFSEAMRATIKSILLQNPPVEDLMSDFEGTRLSPISAQDEKSTQEEEQPHVVQSAKSALLKHITSYPKHPIEKNWEVIKSCFSKLQENQASGRGVVGVDLDFKTSSNFDLLSSDDLRYKGFDLSGKDALKLLKQLFISKNLRSIVIKDLVGNNLEHFFNLLKQHDVSQTL